MRAQPLLGAGEAVGAGMRWRGGSAAAGALRWSGRGEQAVATRAGEKDGEVGAAAFKSKRGNAGKDDFESVVRAGGASVLVVPRAEGRGLDFPDVTHVYCFNLGARRTAALASPPPLAGRL